MAMMSEGSHFWGCNVSAGKPLQLELSQPLQLSQASLFKAGTHGTLTVSVASGRAGPFVLPANVTLCTLSTHCPSCQLSVYFPADSSLVFHVNGNAQVSLSGIMVDSEPDEWLPTGVYGDFDDDSEDESVEGEGAGLSKAMASAGYTLEQLMDFSEDDSFEPLDSEEDSDVQKDQQLLMAEAGSDSDALDEEVSSGDDNGVDSDDEEALLDELSSDDEVAMAKAGLTFADLDALLESGNPSSSAKKQKKDQQQQKGKKEKKKQTQPQVEPQQHHEEAEGEVEQEQQQVEKVVKPQQEKKKKKKKKMSLQAQKKRIGRWELTYIDLIEGTGAKAVKEKTVRIRYEGRLAQNKLVFDSSKHKCFTFIIGKGQVIEGLDEGVIGMRPGGKRELFIPPELAYGAEGVVPDIPPNSGLMFTIELVGYGSGRQRRGRRQTKRQTSPPSFKP